jgi:hypothetical protein
LGSLFYLLGSFGKTRVYPPSSQPASHPLRTRESFSLRGKEIKEIKEEEPS